MEATAGFVGAVVAEEQVLLRFVVKEHPAHDVDADPVGGFVELQRIAPALVHRTTVFAQQRGVAEVVAEGRLARQHGSHGQHAVEPVAELAGEALGDQVGRIPLGPVFRIAAVAGGAEGHDARIQPRIADVGDATCCAATLRAGDPDCVNVRPVRRVAFELLPTLGGQLLQLVLRTDHVEMAALLVIANPDRQRQAVVALLADHPVVHVAQPVQFAFVAEAGYPADVVHHLHDLVAQALLYLFRRHFAARLVVERSHVDEPLVHQTEDQLGAAAPADRVAVGVILEPVDQPLAAQIVEDALGHF